MKIINFKNIVRMVTVYFFQLLELINRTVLDRNVAHRLLMKNNRIGEAGENKSRELLWQTYHIFFSA